METSNITVEEMEGNVARFSNLHGSGEAYVFERLNQVWQQTDAIAKAGSSQFRARAVFRQSSS